MSNANLAVNLELQLKFLKDLDTALDDALVQYNGAGSDKVGELAYMKQEVSRAKRIVSRKLVGERSDLRDRPHTVNFLPEAAAG